MPSLIAKPPFGATLPVTVGATSLTAVDPGPVTSVAPYDEAALGKALKKAHGLSFPAPNTTATKGAARIVWTGRAQAFLIGPAPGDLPGAALTDQSDAWTLFHLAGPQAVAALARLVPLDLRPAAFPETAAARSLLGHMPLILWREGPDAFALMTFRSMTATAVHELTEALTTAAATTP